MKMSDLEMTFRQWLLTVVVVLVVVVLPTSVFVWAVGHYDHPEKIEPFFLTITSTLYE